MPIRIDGEEWFRCPRRPLKDDPRWWEEFLALFAMYKKGFLPEHGGVQDQPHFLVQAMHTFEGAVAQADASREEITETRPKGNPFAGQGNGAG